MRTTAEHRFERGDPVLAYWLAHCEGFAVERPNGRREGTVADVVLDDHAETVVAVSVERPQRRSAVAVPAERVAAVIPARQTIVLAPPARRPPRGPGRTRVAGAAAVRGAGRGSVRLVQGAGNGSARAAGGAARAWTALDRRAERGWGGLAAWTRTSAVPATRRAWTAADTALEVFARRALATWRQLREDRRRPDEHPGA